MHRKRKQGGIQVTLPVSDTVPAPGNYTVEVLNLGGQGMPVVNSTGLIDNLGAGTARDISSALQAPVPGRAGDLDGEPTEK